MFLFSGCAARTAAPPASGLGLTLVKQFRDRYGIAVSSNDAPYLRELVDRLLKSSSRSGAWNGPYDIIVIKNASPLAASVGDNFIVLTTGLIQRLDVEAELTFILAHELAHYLLGHTTWVAHQGINLEDKIEELPDLESAADRLGLELLIDAGYDPRLARVAIAKAYQGAGIDTPTPSHPNFITRISELEVALARSHWTPPATVDRRAFHEFKYGL